MPTFCVFFVRWLSSVLIKPRETKTEEKENQLTHHWGRIFFLCLLDAWADVCTNMKEKEGEKKKKNVILVHHLNIHSLVSAAKVRYA